MKNGKKAAAICLSAVLASAAFGMPGAQNPIAPALLCATAADSGVIGESITWALDTNGVLTLSGTGAMPDGIAWPFEAGSVYSIVLESGITGIGSNAFQYFEHAVELNLPDTVTSIGSEAFKKCRNLTKLSLPASVAQIGSCAFVDCSALTEFTVAAANQAFAADGGVLYSLDRKTLIACPAGKRLDSFSIPETVTCIADGAFSANDALLTLRMPNGLTELGACALQGASSLRSVQLPKLLSRIGTKAFAGCEQLAKINVDSANQTFFVQDGVLYDRKTGTLLQCPPAAEMTTLNVPAGIFHIAESAVADCKQLTHVNFPQGLRTVGPFAFSGCSGLRSVVLPASVSLVNSFAFSQCSALQLVVLPDGGAELGYGAFSGCTGIRTAVFGKTMGTTATSAFPTGSKMTVYGYADTPVQLFAAANSLSFVALPETASFADCTLSAAADGSMTLTSCTSTASVVQVRADISAIADDAYAGCTNMFAVKIPANVKTIGEDAFLGCERLSVICGYAGTAAETYAAAHGYAFFPVGDINLEGAVDSNDAVLALRTFANHMLGQETLSVCEQMLADVNCDGAVDADDAVLILRYYAKTMLQGADWLELL